MSLVANDATFESDIGHWGGYVYSYLLRDTYSVTPHAGSAVMRMYVNLTSSENSPRLGNGDSGDFYYVSPGDVVNVSTWTQRDVRNTLASYTVMVTLTAYNTSGGSIGQWNSTVDSVIAGSWGQSTVSATMPAGAAHVTINFAFRGPSAGDVAAGDVFYISDVSANLQHVPQPTNNDFVNAVGISGDSGSTSGTTIGATYEFIPYDEHQSFPEEWPNDVWYEYTNEGRGQVDLDLLASGYNTHHLVVYRQESHGGPADVTMLLNTGQTAYSSTTPLWSNAFFYNPSWRYFIRVGSALAGSDTFTLTWHFNPLDGSVEARGLSESIDVATRVYPANLVARLVSENTSILTSTPKPGAVAAGLGWIGKVPDVPMVGQAFRCQEWVESLAVGFRHFWIGWSSETGPFFYSFISEDGFFPNWNNEYEYPSGFGGGFFAGQTTSAMNGSLVTLYGIDQRMNQTPLRRFLWPFGDMEHGGTWHWETGTTGMTIGVSSVRSHSPSHSLEAIVGTTQGSGVSVWAHADNSAAIYVDKNKQYVLRNWTSSFQTSYTGLSTLGTGFEKVSSPLGETSSSGYVTSFGFPNYFDYNYNYLTLQTTAWERYLKPFVNVYPDYYAPRPLTAGDRYYWDDIEISEYLYSTVREFRLTTKANDSYKTISGLSDEGYGATDPYHTGITSLSTPIKHLVALDNQNLAGRYWFYMFDADWNLLNRRRVDGNYNGAPILPDIDGRSVVFEYPGINLCKYDVISGTFSTVIASGAPGAVVGVASNGDYVFDNPVGGGLGQFIREPRGGGGYYYVSGQFNLNTQMTTPSRIIQQFKLGIDYTGDYEWFAAFGSTSIDSGGGHYNFVTCFYRRSIDDFDTAPMVPTFTLDHPYVDGTDPSAVNLFTSQPSPSYDIRYVYPTSSCPALFKP